MTQTTTTRPEGGSEAGGQRRGRPQMPPPDILEHGAPKDGQPQTSDRRLFMQLLAFGGCTDARIVGEELHQARIQGVVYEDVNDPKGVAVLTFDEDPAFFTDKLRPLLNNDFFSSLRFKPQYTMLGRTYALGYEQDLNEALFTRPRNTALNPAWPWAVWYPLRRSGAFAQLAHDEQRAILGEHGVIGMAFGQADYGHDIRLACFGLDKDDNDFVIGLIGKELFPLSFLVQTMRKTKQTSQFIEKLGPFFVGKAVWQSAV
jgi:Chlorite dismutase